MRQKDRRVFSMLKEFLKKSFENAVLLGQTKVSDEQFNERVAVCKGCPFISKVEPLPNLVFNEGCTKCSCPLVTKARLTNHSILGSASCELGNWEQIDKKYNDNSELL